MKDVFIVIAHFSNGTSKIVTAFFSEQRADEYCMYMNDQVATIDYGYRRVCVVDSGFYMP